MGLFMDMRRCNFVPRMLVILFAAISLLAQEGSVVTDQVPSAGCAPFVSFNPNGQRNLVFTDEHSRLKLLKKDHSLTLALESDTNFSAVVPLPVEMVQVDQIRIASGVGIAVGMVNGSASEVFLFNLHDPKKSRDFYAYRPSVSPNGEFVTFTKFYPPHFVQGASDVNLLQSVSGAFLGSKMKSSKAEDRVNIGLAVYPPHSSNREGDNVGVPEQRVHHFVSRECFWSGDSDKYVFADQSPDGLMLVVVTINGSGTAVRTFPISLARLCASISKSACQINLVNATFVPEGILARFVGVGADAMVDQTMQVPIEQFKTL